MRCLLSHALPASAWASVLSDTPTPQHAAARRTLLRTQRALTAQLPFACRPGAGFKVDERKRVAAALRRVRTELQRRRVTDGRCDLIATAKVPILSTKLRPPGHGMHSIAADVSLGVPNGLRTVALVQRQLQALPPLRPLMLVLKAALRQAGLGDARSGGLSSYSLLNLVRHCYVFACWWSFLTLLCRHLV